MSTSHIRPDLLDHPDAASGGGPSLGVPGIVLALVTLLALAHPHPLVLPVLSVILVVGGFVMAGTTAWRYRRHLSQMAERQLLAALVLFFGFAAAMLGDPDAAVQSLQQPR